MEQGFVHEELQGRGQGLGESMGPQDAMYVLPYVPPRPLEASGTQGGVQGGVEGWAGAGGAGRVALQGAATQGEAEGGAGASSVHATRPKMLMLDGFVRMAVPAEKRPLSVHVSPPDASSLSQVRGG